MVPQETSERPFGGSDRGSESAQQNGPVSAETQQRIRETHDQDASGTWKAGAKKWVLHQKTKKTGLTAVQLPGVGNCFWEGVSLHMGHESFKVSKKSTADFFKSTVFTALQEKEDFKERFPALQSMNSEEITSELTTDGAYSGERVMQIAALALQYDIKISSTSRPEDGVHTVYKGARGEGEEIKGTIQLLLRNHQKDTIYNSQFCPIGKSDGHFWLIQNETQGNGGRSAQARP